MVDRGVEFPLTVALQLPKSSEAYPMSGHSLEFRIFHYTPVIGLASISMWSKRYRGFNVKGSLRYKFDGASV